MKAALQFRLHQQLSLTPQLQQAIRLLQLSQLELTAELRKIAESNPLLELAEDSDDFESLVDDDEEECYPSGQEGAASATNNDGNDGNDEGVDWADNGVAETPIDFSSSLSRSGTTSNTGTRGSGGDDDFEPQSAAPETLQQHLLWQLNMAVFNPRQHAIASVLIDSLNSDGYLVEGLAAALEVLPSSFKATLEEVDAVRHQLQGFDPTGVGSLDLRDCLHVQLEQFNADTPQRDLALRIVETELELLARNDVARLARRLRASEEDVTNAALLIRSLDPRPGAALDSTPVEYVAPDVYVRRVGQQWQVSLNADAQPQLGLNQHYCGLIAQARGEDASWMRGQLQEARWLIKSLQSRAETLIKVSESIVRRQSAFLDYGPEAMQPLVLREVAEEVGMHESTISRVTTRKYMHTPRGTFELKYFFSSGVSTEDGGSASSTAIQAMLRKLVDAEDPLKPLSDHAIAQELKRHGIQIARRTVAKYRGNLRILSSSERQRVN